MSKSRIIDAYNLIELLGEGSFGKVYLAEDRRDLTLFALKVIAKANLEPSDVFHIQSEIKILSLLDHPNIIRMIEWEEIAEYFIIVFEYARGGELFARIVEKGRFCESEAAVVVRTAMQAIAYCHEIGVVHRDLKPENLLYESREPGARIKVSDFGVSRLTNSPSEVLSTIVGSTSYQAPEILLAQKYNAKCDVYSMGVVLYTLLCGYPPFDEESVDYLNRVEKGILDFPANEWKDVSAEARDLLNGMLQPTAEKRLSAKEVLRHRFFAVANRKTSLSSALENLGMYNNKRKKRLSVIVEPPLAKTANHR